QLWNDACLEDEATARRTAEVVAEILGAQRHDVRACFARTLAAFRNPGIRRVAYLWLVEHEGLPGDYDWRAPAEHQAPAAEAAAVDAGRAVELAAGRGDDGGAATDERAGAGLLGVVAERGLGGERPGEERAVPVDAVQQVVDDEAAAGGGDEARVDVGQRRA